MFWGESGKKAKKLEVDKRSRRRRKFNVRGRRSGKEVKRRGVQKKKRGWRDGGEKLGRRFRGMCPWRLKTPRPLTNRSAALG